MSLIAMTNPGVPGYVAFAESMQQFTAIWQPLGWVLSSAGVPGIPDRSKWQTPSFSSSLAVDASQGDLVFVTLTGNVTSGAIVNSAEGQELTIVVKQDATGGRTWAWAPGINVHGWPTLSTGAGTEDTVQLVYRAANSTWYTVEASVGTGAVDTTPPDAPTGVVATGTDSASHVQWNGVDGAANYDVYQSTDGSTLGTAVKTRVTVTSVAITGLTNGTTYYYRVKARDAAGNVSSESAQASVTPPVVGSPTPPAAPTGVSVIPGVLQAEVDWSAVTGASTYLIFRSSASGSLGTQVASGIIGTSYLVTGLVAGTYFFTVKAVDSAGTVSAASTQVAGTVSPATNTSQRLFVNPTTHQLVVGSRTSTNRVKLLGVNIWGHNDHVTISSSVGDNLTANREALLNTLVAWGVNVVRFRLTADDYEAAGTTNGTYFASKAASIQRVKDWRDSVVARGMYFVPCWWDGLYSGVNLTTAYAADLPMMTAVYQALGDDPYVWYEPYNEPNNITEANWVATMKHIIDHWRTTLHYQGVLCLDTGDWSHHYDDTNLNTLESYDAGKTTDGSHNLIFAKHDYMNETGDVATSAAWLANNGAGGDWNPAQTHIWWESETGTHNGDADGTHTATEISFMQMLMTRFAAQPTFAGVAAFLSHWVDTNTMFALGNYSTPNTWGAGVRDAYRTITGGAPTPPPPSTGGGGGGTTVKLGWELLAADTGVQAGITLATVASDQTYGTAFNGQPITAKKFTGAVTVTGDNITFTNCEFDKGVDVTTGTNIDFNYCLLKSTTASARDQVAALGASSDTTGFYRCRFDATNTDLHLAVAGDRLLLDQCWLMDGIGAGTTGGIGSYYAVAITGGDLHEIKNSSISMGIPATGSIATISLVGTIHGVKIHDCFLDGGNEVFLLGDGLQDLQVPHNHFGGHQNPFYGIYAPTLDVSTGGLTFVETVPSSGSANVYWPTTSTTASNLWDRCSDLSPDRTGAVVTPATGGGGGGGGTPLTGFADATNTGYTHAPGYPGSLASPPGSISSGQTISFKNFVGGLDATASDVTFVGCRFAANATLNVVARGNRWTFKYCTFEPSAVSSTPVAYDDGYQYGVFMPQVGGVATGGHSFENCDFWGFGNAIQVDYANASFPFVCKDSWFHDCRDNGGVDHTDAILCNYGDNSHFTVTGCTIDCDANTQGLALQNGPISDVTVVGNLFSGFGATIAIGGHGPWTNVTFTDNVYTNHFSPTFALYDPGFATDTGCLWRRNKYKVVSGGFTPFPTDGSFWLPDNDFTTTHTADFTG